MLVLSRRTNETLVIDNNIRFTVLSVHGNQVRIGIEAPDDIIVLREEIIANADRSRGSSYAPQKSASNIPDPQVQANTPHAHNGSNEQGKRRGVLGLRRRRP